MKLQLTYPLKSVLITQKFGNMNQALYGSSPHSGIDFQAKHGTPIYASHDGFASFQIDAGGGHGVVVVTDKEYDYNDTTSYYKTIYWHMVDGLKEPSLQSPIADKTGFVTVKTGDLLGYADNTGHSTGDHLHFALKPVAKGENWGTWYNLEQGSVYFGAIDPTPFLPILDTHTNTTFPINLKYGDKGNEVKKLQIVLTQLGFLDDKIDGIYGKNTKTAVLAFQVMNKIISTPLESLYGFYCGKKTRLVLNSLK